MRIFRWLVVGACLLTPAFGGVILSNLPGNDQVNDTVVWLSAKAIGFTMGPQDYNLDSVDVRLNNQSPGEINITISALLIGGTPAAPAGPTLTGLGQVVLSPGALGTYSFLPASPITLAAGQSYWIYLHSGNSGARLVGSAPDQLPTGPGATYSGMWASSGTIDFIGSFAVNATPTAVPEPSTAGAALLGLLALLALRRR